MKQGSKLIEFSSKVRRDIEKFKCKRIAKLLAVSSGLNAIAEGFPERYHWRFKSVEAFQLEASNIVVGKDGAKQFNQLYWRDTLSALEAYTVMALWRMIDLSQAAIRMVEEENIIPSSVLARSALESAIQFAHDSRIMAATLEDISKADLINNIATSEELEHLILSTVYSSRQSGADDIYKSKNILTVIDKIAKVAKGDPIKEQYELLCELTHPNFLGRSLYIVDVEELAPAGDQLRILGHQNGLRADLVLESTLWSLSWAIEAQGSSIHLLQGSIQKMFKSFEFLKLPSETKPDSAQLH